MKEEGKLENLKKDKKSSWGGIREGSGRKPRLQYEARELFYNAIDDEWENIIKILKYQIHRGDKEILKWTIEQRIGKAFQNVDIIAKGALLNIPAQIKNKDGVDIMAIAKGVSEKLRKIKTG
ncbi:MAG: hypothetical protein WCI93_03750 [bacterium]